MWKFLPKMSMKETLKLSFDQMVGMCENSIRRLLKLPGLIYEFTGLNDAWIDGRVVVQNSLTKARKLITRDALKMDDPGFLDEPMEGYANGRKFLSSIYSWASFHLLGYGLGQTLGTFDRLTSVFRPIFPRSIVLIWAMILPFYLHSLFRKRNEYRKVSFWASVLLGFMFSYGIGKPLYRSGVYYLPTMLAYWISASMGYRPIGSRLSYLVYFIGIPGIVDVLAMWTLFSWIYALALASIYALVTLDFQLRLGRLQRGWAGRELEVGLYSRVHSRSISGSMPHPESRRIKRIRR